jgi:hypothetical protein
VGTRAHAGACFGGGQRAHSADAQRLLRWLRHDLVMNQDDLVERYDGSELLELLALCGWTIRPSPSPAPALRAVRDGVQVAVQADSLPEAIRRLFLRAMRSGSVDGRASTSVSASLLPRAVS